MKIAKYVTSATVGTLLATTVIASNDGLESNQEIQNTYQHEYSDDRVPAWAEQDRERHIESNRLQSYFAEGDAGAFKLKANNRYQYRERNRINRGDGGFGRPASSRPGGAASGAGKGSRGRL